MPHKRIRKMNSRGGLLAPDIDYQVSQAVRAGNMVFLTGQTGLSLDMGEFTGVGDPAAQAENAMHCIKVLLEEAGSHMRDICKVTTYVTDISYRETVYPVLAKHLKDIHPCSTGLVVKDLALPEIDFEIDVIAVIPEK